MVQKLPCRIGRFPDDSCCIVIFGIIIHRILPEYDILVISDYGKGLISEDLCRYLIKLAHKYDKKVIIDPKGKNWEKYSGADIVTPNVKELSDIVGYTVPNTDRAIEKAAREAITNNHLTALLVTRRVTMISTRVMPRRSLRNERNLARMVPHLSFLWPLTAASYSRCCQVTVSLCSCSWRISQVT